MTDPVNARTRAGRPRLRGVRRGIVLIAAAVAVVPVGVSAALAATAPGGTDRSQAQPPGLGGAFVAVTATSASDAWAVGNSWLNGSPLPMIAHWDGQAWQLAKVTAPPTNNGSELTGVAAISARNAWAVGSSFSDNTSTGLTYHWTGTAWQLVTNPAARVDSLLSGVAASSARDIWAVGAIVPFQTAPGGPLILHWNGTAWRRMPFPNRNAQLSGVAVRSAGDAWAVGAVFHRTSIGMFILHWNGQHWSHVAAPALRGDAWLTAVAVNSARNAWAVGRTASGHPVALHWNGRTWRIVPGMPAAARSLNGVAIVARNYVWAVGSTQRGATFIARWNGHIWRRLTSPSPGGGGAALRGVVARSASNAWAVGGSQPVGGTALAHILHWNGTSWVVSPVLPAP